MVQTGFAKAGDAVDQARMSECVISSACQIGADFGHQRTSNALARRSAQGGPVRSADLN
jgi:hypothetical protein